MAEQKLAKKRPIDKINELITFYEKWKPASGKRIEVLHTPTELAKMLGYATEKGKKVERKEFEYRGRTIVAIK